MSYLVHSLGRGVLPHCRSAVGVFYNPSRQGNNTVRELPITQEQLRLKSRNDDSILEMKDQIIGKVKNRNVNESNAFLLCDGVLRYTDRVVIPTSFRKCMLKEFHVGHRGIYRMKSRMRCYTYWPKMDEDIQNLVLSCRGCALAAIKFQPWPETDIPWSRLHLDFTGPFNRAYYLVVDIQKGP